MADEKATIAAAEEERVQGLHVPSSLWLENLKYKSV
jgi:hypothetical protein